MNLNEEKSKQREFSARNLSKKLRMSSRSL